MEWRLFLHGVSFLSYRQLMMIIQTLGRFLPKGLPPPRQGMVEKAQESKEFIENMDYRAFLELMAFFYSNEFMFMFLVVMGYLFWKRANSGGK